MRVANYNVLCGDGTMVFDGAVGLLLRWPYSRFNLLGGKKCHMQGQWARLARRGWCAGVVPTAPRSLVGTRREMRQVETPVRGGAARVSLGL